MAADEVTDRLWAVPDVAAFLHVTEAAVRGWVYERRIRFIKIGSLVRFAPAQVTADALAGRIGKPTREPSAHE